MTDSLVMAAMLDTMQTSPTSSFAFDKSKSTRRAPKHWMGRVPCKHRTRVTKAAIHTTSQAKRHRCKMGLLELQGLLLQQSTTGLSAAAQAVQIPDAIKPALAGDFGAVLSVLLPKLGVTVGDGCVTAADAYGTIAAKARAAVACAAESGNAELAVELVTAGAACLNTFVQHNLTGCAWLRSMRHAKSAPCMLYTVCPPHALNTGGFVVSWPQHTCCHQQAAMSVVVLNITCLRARAGHSPRVCLPLFNCSHPT